jgi:long-chain acyl-CoA synthetase
MKMGDLVFQKQCVQIDVINRRAERAAISFLNKGIWQGALIAVRLKNELALIEAYKAIGWIGAVPVLLSTDLSADDFTTILRRERFDAIVTSEEFAASLPFDHGVPLILTAGANWDLFINAAVGELEQKLVSPGARFLTSGSSGIPKTVVRAPLPKEIASLRDSRFVASWGIVKGMRTAATGPLFHQAPLYHVMSALAVAEQVVLLDRFDARSVLSAIAEHRLTHIHMVPRLMKKIADLDDCELDRYDTSSLKFVLHGAAACPASVKERLISRWGMILREYYATSEFGMVSEIDSEEWLRRRSSVGRAFDGVEIEVRDLETGLPCPTSTPGRIFVRSDDMPDFYYITGLDKSQISTRKRGEFLTVNDVGYLDQDGYLHLTGRSDDIAVISGINFSAEATRLALLKLPEVEDALVEIATDVERGSCFIAYVKLKSDTGPVSKMSLNQALLKSLPKLAVPIEIYRVDELPATDSGKLIRGYLDRANAIKM